MTDAYIYDAVRTPRGKNRGGALHGTKPIDLAVTVIDAILERNPGLDPALIDDVVLGVVSPVGEQGGDIARAASLVSGLPESVAGVQVNRFCASGLEAVNLAAQKVASGYEHWVLAGGVESMSRVPIGSDGGAYFQDPATGYDQYFVPQGIGADLIATIEGFSRQDVDAFAGIEDAWFLIRVVDPPDGPLPAHHEILREVDPVRDRAMEAIAAFLDRAAPPRD